MFLLKMKVIQVNPEYIAKLKIIDNQVIVFLWVKELIIT